MQVKTTPEIIPALNPRVPNSPKSAIYLIASLFIHFTAARPAYARNAVFIELIIELNGEWLCFNFEHGPHFLIRSYRV
jgi:hypothetical protein